MAEPKQGSTRKERRRRRDGSPGLLQKIWFSLSMRKVSPHAPLTPDNITHSLLCRECLFSLSSPQTVLFLNIFYFKLCCLSILYMRFHLINPNSQSSFPVSPCPMTTTSPGPSCSWVYPTSSGDEEIKFDFIMLFYSQITIS